MQPCGARFELVTQAGIDVDIDRRIAVDAIAAIVPGFEPSALIGAQRLGIGGRQRGERRLERRCDVAVEG